MQSFKRTFVTRAIAWALAFVMVFTMIPYGAFAAGGGSKLELAPAKGPVAVKDAAPPEDTDTTSDAKNAVHGYVGVQVGDDINKNLAKAGKSQFIPKEGVKVYFQWFEKKGNRVSPVYAATSDASGQFHMKVKPYIADDGKLVKFDADTSISAGYESYKFWVDESTIPEGYQLQYSTGESVEFNDAGVAGANNYVIPNKLTDFKVLLMEIPKEDLMHKTATPTPPQIFKTDPGQGAVRGKVSWDYESAGGIQWGIVATHTSPAPDVTVRASYLSDYALKQIFSADTANMLGVSSPSKIRGSGWTFALEKQLQDWIQGQVKAEPDKWIAETVSAVTNAEGDYKIQFNGTWGPERNGVNVAEYNRVAGKYYAGDAHKWSEEEVSRLGTVANSPEEGSFLTGALNHNEKHVNSDWLFISTEGTDKLRVMTPWNNNWYTGSNNAWGIHGGWAQAAFGVSTVQAANSTRADFAFAPAEIKFNITNYDTGLNTATPGDVAKTETKGLPYKNTSDSFRIVWYDAKGNVVKTENAAKPSSTGDFPEATFDTKDVTESKTFTAKLYRVDSKGNNGQLLAQDSFTVKISKLVVSANDEVSIANPGANDDSMKGATYSAEGLPEGLTIDPNNGTISGKATTPGKYTVTVTTTVPDEDSGEPAEGISQYVALVTDSPLADGNVNSAYSETVKPTEVEGYVFKNVTAKFIDGKAIDGLTITKDQISGTPTAKVEATEDDPNVEVTYDIYKLNEKGEEVLIKKGHVDKVPLSIKDGESAKYEPEYKAVDGKIGEEAKVAAPTFTDKEGNPATPENVKYALGEGAPEGAVVNADGSVTYTPVEADAEKSVEIPVVVKYADGSTDNAKAVINVAKKATTADKVKELGGLNPQTIKVWKGDKFDWPDGVVPANDTNSDAVNALLDKATITDTNDPARDSSTAGKFGGTLLVTFEDGSTIKVPNQMLIVSDHVVVIDPNNTDLDAPKKEDLPKGSVPVRFSGKTGISKVNTNGVEVYAKMGATLEESHFPTDITFEDGYQGPVTWNPTDHKVTNRAPYYNKRGTFTFVGNATLPDVIDRTGDEDKPTPEGYVRVTFKNGEGVNNIENNKVYDVKEGTALTADKYPTVTAKDGFENPEWSTPAETPITADNATITATAKAKAPGKDTTKPEIGDLDDDNDPTTPVAPKEDENNKGPQVWANGARVVEGQNIKAITVNVTDDKDKNPTVDVTGLPKGLSYNKATKQIEGAPDKLTDWADTEEERDVTATITAKDAAGNDSTKEIQITVLRDTDGDGMPDTTDPDDDNDGIKDEKDKTPKAWDANVDGKVTTPKGTQPTVDQYKDKITNLPDGSKVAVKTEPDVSKAGDTEAVVTVTLPNGEEVDVTVPVTVTDATPAEKTEKPVITAPKAGDKEIKGTAPAGSEVTVTLPDGSEIKATADDQGNWKAAVPEGKELKGGEIVKAVAKEEGKNPSDEATATVTTEDGEVCILPEALQKQFEDAANKMFEDIKSKDGVYEATFDRDKKIVEVKILDKKQGAKELSGTGLATGLEELYRNNHLAKVQVGTQPERDLATIEEKQPTTEMTLLQLYKLMFGSDIINEVQKTGDKTGTLADFVGKTVELKLTIQQKGCDGVDPIVLTYTINGVDGTQPAEKTDAPTVEKPNAGDKEIKGKAPAGSDVTVTLPDGTKIETKADDQGNWTATVPEDKELAENDEIKVVAKDGDKAPSDEVTETVGPKAVEEKTDAPTVEKPNAGDKEIKGKAPAGSDVTVTLPDGTKIETKADDQGNWTATVPEDKELAENDEIKVVAKDGDKAPSDEVTETVGPKAVEEKTDAPTVEKPNAGDKEIKGKAPAGSDVTVTLPDGTKIETKADDQGNWTATVPEDKELAENDEIKVVAKDGDKAPSDEVTETVGPKAVEEKTDAPTVEKPNAGDKEIKGKSPAGSDVTVTLPDGTKIETKADDQGNWTATVPEDKELAENDEIKVVAKDGDKAPSDEVTETVGPKEDTPEDKKTEVTGNVNSVDPTDKPQDTGIDVTNPDKDTKISAKDEDGKDVPVEIDKDGNVIVTPGKNVDGPITVTITDPDLPNGKKDITVPVNGHEAGRDDNRSGKDNSGGYWIIPSTPSKTDDKPKHETAIHKLYIYGYEDSTFRPEGNMTRAEAAAMLARLQGLDLSNKARPNFIDVRSGWYNAVINAVVEAGYMKGYPDGTFRPDGKITRAEFAQMIKAIDKANRGAAPFADVKGHWAENAINQAYVNGRIAGYPDETFRPNNHITRAEAVTVFNKLYDRSVNFTGLSDVATAIAPFKDVAGNHWAYYEIIESSNTHEFYRTEAGKVDETWVRLVQSWKQALANR